MIAWYSQPGKDYPGQVCVQMDTGYVLNAIFQTSAQLARWRDLLTTLGIPLHERA
jgi:hypothetical protein